MRYRFLLAFAILFTSGIVGVPQPQAACDVEKVAYQAQDFLDTVEIAGYTPRNELSPIALELRRMQRVFERADCGESADELVENMGAVTDGVIEFMGGESLAWARTVEPGAARIRRALVALDS